MYSTQIVVVTTTKVSSFSTSSFSSTSSSSGLSKNNTASGNSNDTNKNKGFWASPSKIIATFVIVGVVILIIILCCLWVFFIKPYQDRKNQKSFERKYNEILQNTNDPADMGMGGLGMMNEMEKGGFVYQGTNPSNSSINSSYPEAGPGTHTPDNQGTALAAATANNSNSSNDNDDNNSSGQNNKSNSYYGYGKRNSRHSTHATNTPKQPSSAHSRKASIYADTGFDTFNTFHTYTNDSDLHENGPHTALSSLSSWEPDHSGSTINNFGHTHHHPGAAYDDPDNNTNNTNNNNNNNNHDNMINDNTNNNTNTDRNSHAQSFAPPDGYMSDDGAFSDYDSNYHNNYGNGLDHFTDPRNLSLNNNRLKVVNGSEISIDRENTRD